jgi:hypothetical protein
MCIEDRIARALADVNDPNLADFMANDGYPGDTPAYQARHAAPSFPTEPEPGRTPYLVNGQQACGETVPGTFFRCERAPGHGDLHPHMVTPTVEPSIFDAPDAATTHAKQTAQALIHEYRTFASQPGHWTAEQSASWIGQACAVLTELAK